MYEEYDKRLANYTYNEGGTGNAIVKRLSGKQGGWNVMNALLVLTVKIILFLSEARGLQDNLKQNH
jgi:hypothetical protein